MCMCAGMHVCVNACVRACMCACMFARARVCVCVCVCVCACVYACIILPPGLQYVMVADLVVPLVLLSFLFFPSQPGPLRQTGGPWLELTHPTPHTPSP